MTGNPPRHRERAQPCSFRGGPAVASLFRVARHHPGRRRGYAILSYRKARIIRSTRKSDPNRKNRR